MKRMLSIILAMLLLATLFAGCAGNTAPANSDTPATTDTAQTVTDKRWKMALPQTVMSLRSVSWFR